MDRERIDGWVYLSRRALVQRIDLGSELVPFNSNVGGCR